MSTHKILILGRYTSRVIETAEESLQKITRYEILKEPEMWSMMHKGLKAWSKLIASHLSVVMWRALPATPKCSPGASSFSSNLQG